MVSGVLVHDVEGNATGLHGSCLGGALCAMGHQICKSPEVCTGVDGSASSLDGFSQAMSFGVSTDVLLFSDINESLVNHYRVHKRGLPHLTFRKDYLTCLRAFVSRAAALSQGDMVSPVQSSPVSMRHARSSEQEPESLRKDQTCPSTDSSHTST